MRESVGLPKARPLPNARERWLTGVPEEKKATLIPAGWFDAWADATWATDPVGAKMNPPLVRAPNGGVQDGAEYWSAGKAYYDPAKIAVPTLLVQAEWDRDTPPYMAQTLFPLLVNSPGKRYVLLAEGTHTRSSWSGTGSSFSRRFRRSSTKRRDRRRLGRRTRSGGGSEVRRHGLVRDRLTLLRALS